MERRWQKGRLLGIALLLVLLPAEAGTAAEAPGRIGPAELAALMAQAKPPLLINNMGLIECLDHSIAGSRCIAAEEMAARIGELPADKGHPLVFYCESEVGSRSCNAADVAVQNGYRTVLVLEGGLPAWKAAGYETVSRERIPRRSIASIKPAVLQRRLLQRENLFLVDIRPEPAFREGHIAGALHLPMYQLHHRWREIPLDRPVILVDNRGFRSPLAASYLAAKGFAVEPLFGGMRAWKAMESKDRKRTAGR